MVFFHKMNIHPLKSIFCHPKCRKSADFGWISACDGVFQAKMDGAFRLVAQNFCHWRILANLLPFMVLNGNYRRKTHHFRLVFPFFLHKIDEKAAFSLP